MRKETAAAVKAILAADLDVGPDTVRAVLRALHGESRPRTELTIKTREAAALLDVHPKSVLRYARRGLLHPIRRSARAIRWRKSEVEALASEGTRQ